MKNIINLNYTLLLILHIWPENYGFTQLEHFFCTLDRAYSHVIWGKMISLL